MSNPYQIEYPYPKNLYIKLWKNTKKIDASNFINYLVDAYGYKVDSEFMESIIMITRISIKNEPNTYLDGYILYAITCKFMEKYRLGNIYILDVKTEKGFNALCMAKAAQDMEKETKIYTIDNISHKEPIYWNCILDEEGKKSIKELLSPWKELRDNYMYFQEGETDKVLDNLNKKFRRFHIVNLNCSQDELAKNLRWVAEKQKGGDVIFCSNILNNDIIEESEDESNRRSIDEESISILVEFVKNYPYRYKIFYDEKNDIGYAYLKKYKGNVRESKNSIVV